MINECSTRSKNGMLCMVDPLGQSCCRVGGGHSLCSTRIFGDEYASEGWWCKSNRTTAKRVARPRRAALPPDSWGPWAGA